MKEQMISYKVAKLAKEKGFNIESDKYYCIVPIEEQKIGDVVIEEETYTHIVMGKGEVVWFRYAPITSQSLLQKWLREKHNIVVFIAPYPTTYAAVIEYNNREDKYATDLYDTYEEALETGLEQALKLIDNGDKNKV